MDIVSLGLILCGATKKSPLFQKGRTIMELIDAVLAVGLLTTALLLLFAAAR